MTVAIDPLAPALLPGYRDDERPAQAGAVRPFGLTRQTPLPTDQIRIISNVSYDPVRQVSVTGDGTPVVDRPLSAASISTTKTKADGQEWDDRDPDD